MENNMRKKDEHYIDNEEFLSILKENKQIIKEHFKDKLSEVDFTKGVDKMKFEKQINIFEIRFLKLRIKENRIDLTKEEKARLRYIQTKIAKALKADKKIRGRREENSIAEKNKSAEKIQKCTSDYSEFLVGLDLSDEIRSEFRKEKRKEMKRLRSNEIKHRENKCCIQLLIHDKVPPIPRYRRLQNKLGTMFLRISRGILTKANFINYTKDRHDDMVSESTFHMSRYVLLFDTELSNPFSYFTTVCNRAFLQCLNKQNKYSDKFQPLMYIENMHKKDNRQVEDWD